MNSFLDGKKTAPAPALNSPRTAAARTNPALGRLAPSLSCSAHTLEVVKEGDKVVRLIITCACGEKTEVDCIYPLGG